MLIEIFEVNSFKYSCAKKNNNFHDKFRINYMEVPIKFCKN